MLISHSRQASICTELHREKGWEVEFADSVRMLWLKQNFSTRSHTYFIPLGRSWCTFTSIVTKAIQNLEAWRGCNCQNTKFRIWFQAQLLDQNREKSGSYIVSHSIDASWTLIFITTTSSSKAFYEQCKRENKSTIVTRLLHVKRENDHLASIYLLDHYSKRSSS